MNAEMQLSNTAISHLTLSPFNMKKSSRGRYVVARGADCCFKDSAVQIAGVEGYVKTAVGVLTVEASFQ